MVEAAGIRCDTRRRRRRIPSTKTHVARGMHRTVRQPHGTIVGRAGMSIEKDSRWGFDGP